MGVGGEEAAEGGDDGLLFGNGVGAVEGFSDGFCGSSNELHEKMRTDVLSNHRRTRPG